jgi:hypothetical protein
LPDSFGSISDTISKTPFINCGDFIRRNEHLKTFSRAACAKVRPPHHAASMKKSMSFWRLAT